MMRAFIERAGRCVGIEDADLVDVFMVFLAFPLAGCGVITVFTRPALAFGIWAGSVLVIAAFARWWPR